MTAVEDRPKTEIGAARQAQGGPAPHHRSHQVDRQHPAPGHAAPRHGPQPVRPRHDHRHRHRGGEGRRRACWPSSPARTSRTPRARMANAWPITDRPEGARRTRRSRSTASPAPARSSPSSWPAPPRRPATPPSSSTSTTTSCPPCSTLKEAVEDAVLAHPDLGTNKSRLLAARLRRARAPAATSTRRSRRPAPTASSSSASTASSGSSRPSWSRARRWCDPTGEQITMWTSTQVPHILRFLIAATTGIPESKVRVIAPDVGGGFGGKLQTTPEEFIDRSPPRGTSASRCKYTETRSESLVSGHHGRDQWQKLTLAATKDGTVTGLKVDLLADLGAYARPRDGGVPVLGRVDVQRHLQVPGLPVQLHQTVFTNKTWTDAYRGAGRPEATYAIERLMDELAAEVGVDPLEIREKNWIKHEEFPFTSVRGHDVRLGQLRGGHGAGQGALRLRRACGASSRSAATARTRSSSASASPPSPRCAASRRRASSAALNYGAGGWEHAEHPDAGRPARSRSSPAPRRTARATRRRGARSSPTGSACPFEDVEVLHGDTQIAPRGLDTYGSRSLVVGGEALVRGRRQGRSRRPRPSRPTCSRPASTTWSSAPGRFKVKGTDNGIGMAEVASAAFTSHDLPEGVEPTLDADATFDPDDFSFPHGTHLCAMEVDTETGAGDDAQVRLPSTTSATSSTRSSSRARCTAASSRASRRRCGRRPSSTTRAPWCRARSSTTPCPPRPTRSPSSRTTPSRPSTTNDLGAKGVGEAGCIASTPAVVNAIVDALRPLGINDIQMPCTPERVWKAIQSAGSNQADATTGESPSRTSTPAPPTRTPRTPSTAPPRRTEQASDPRIVRLRRPHLGRRRPGRPGRGRRRRQGDGRRPEPAAHPADAAQRPGEGHRPRPDRGAQGGHRGRRPRRHRRHDHVCRCAGERSRAPARGAAHRRDRRGGRPADPAPRHRRWRARPRRPGR